MSFVGSFSRLISLEGYASIEANDNVFYEIGYFHNIVGEVP
jgi:hypothetical protein